MLRRANTLYLVTFLGAAATACGDDGDSPPVTEQDAGIDAAVSSSETPSDTSSSPVVTLPAPSSSTSSASSTTPGESSLSIPTSTDPNSDPDSGSVETTTEPVITDDAAVSSTDGDGGMENTDGDSGVEATDASVGVTTDVSSETMTQVSTTDVSSTEIVLPPYEWADSGAWVLTSPEFAEGEAMPYEFTCHGGEFATGGFPGLDWTAGPPGAKSYAVFFIDTSVMDANQSTSPVYSRAFHWAIWDIPAGVRSLPAALGEDDDEFPDTVPGARQWAVRNQFGYFPPCPNNDPASFDAATAITDNYKFVLFALDTEVFEYPARVQGVNNYTRTLYDAVEAAAIAKIELTSSSDAQSIAAPPALDPATLVFPTERPTNDQ